MYTDIDSLVQKIHKTPQMATIATTGGGTRIFPMLLENGNGSKTLIGGNIPYDPAEHEEFLGGKCDKWVSESDARALAMAAYLKARRWKAPEEVVGIGATSSLQRLERNDLGLVIEERKGRKHSIFIALQAHDRTITHSLVFDNETLLPCLMEGTDGPELLRKAEEKLTAKMMLNLLSEGCGLPDRVKTNAEEAIVRREAIAQEIHPSLGNVMYIDDVPLYVGVMCGDGLMTPLPNYAPTKGLIPGSFNPIHDGHRLMKAELADYLSRQDPDGLIGYEISIRNADKPPLDFLSIKDRLLTIAASPEQSAVFLTNAPTFVQKAALFPNCSFGCGYDTAERIVDPKYYNRNPGVRDKALREMQDLGTRFVVFGRKQGEEFLTLGQIDCPEFSKMAIGIHEVRFRQDISSTELRKKGNQ